MYYSLLIYFWSSNPVEFKIVSQFQSEKKLSLIKIIKLIIFKTEKRKFSFQNFHKQGRKNVEFE